MVFLIFVLMWHCNQCGENDLSRKAKERRICKQCDAARSRQWRTNNMEKRRQYEQYVRVRSRAQQREYQKDYFRNRYSNNEGFRMKQLLRNRLRQAVRNGQKSASTLALLGCTVEHLIEHLQSQLPPGANLADYHIDQLSCEGQCITPARRSNR